MVCITVTVDTTAITAVVVPKKVVRSSAVLVKKVSSRSDGEVASGGAGG